LGDPVVARIQTAPEAAVGQHTGMGALDRLTNLVFEATLWLAGRPAL